MTGKILAIDDDPDIISALASILEASGYECVTARDGVEGLAKLRLEKPDAIILDLLMPRMDGYGFCREIERPGWEEFHGTPILVLTTHREEADRQRWESETGCVLSVRYELDTGRVLSVDDYLEKPIVPDILLKKVELISRRWEEHKKE